MTEQGLKPLPETLVGRILQEQFRIVSVLAHNGSIRIYRAEHVPSGRPIAVKTLAPHPGRDGELDADFQRRFFARAAGVARLRHPNTASLFDYGCTSEGLFFVVSELVAGRSLFKVIREQAPLAARRTTHIAIQIARALREAHYLGLTHGELTPRHVMLTHNAHDPDFVKLLDLDQLEPERTLPRPADASGNRLMGSPQYMAPEQIAGEQVDARADIYALGAMLYEMLTGRAPFDRESDLNVLLAHTQEPVPALRAPDCPAALNDLVMRCLEKTPGQRPASMEEVIFALKHASGMPTTTTGSFAATSVVHRTPPIATGASGVVRAVAPEPRPMDSPPSSTLPLPSTPPPARVGLLPRVAVAAAVAISGSFLMLRLMEGRAPHADAPKVRAASRNPPPRELPRQPSQAPQPERVAPAEHTSGAGAAMVTESDGPGVQTMPHPAEPVEPRSAQPDTTEAPEPAANTPHEARKRVRRPSTRRAQAPRRGRSAAAIRQAGADEAAAPRQRPGGIRPVYPQAALASGVQGDVLVAFDVLPDGRVTRPEILKGPPILGAAVLSAAVSWRFLPATLHGRPVKRRVTRRVHFAFRDAHAPGQKQRRVGKVTVDSVEIR